MIPELSRWIREGPLASTVPWRARRWIEQQTADRAYPSCGPSLIIPVTSGSAKATLLFGGDLAFHHWPSGEGTDPAEVLAGLKPVLEGCDARFFNLESQLTARSTPAGTIGTFLRAEPDAAKALGYLDLTAVTCANNHCLDFGPEALSESIERLAANGILATGILRPDRNAATVVAVGGVRVGLLAYADDWYEAEHAPPLPRPAPHEPAQVKEDLVALRSAAEVIVVQLHWGYEWTMYPMRSLRDWARSYVEAGADLVICHHAHVPSGVERWHQGLIAYGLGNTYFGPRVRGGDRHPFRSRSYLLRVRVAQRTGLDAEVIPIQTTEAGRVGVSSGRERDRMLRAVACLSRRLDRTGYLDRVERQVVATQGSQVIRDLAGRLSRGDAAGARERVRFLGRPRQRWLVDQLTRRDDFLSDAGELLGRLEEKPDAVARPAIKDRILALGSRADRWLARAIPIGRLP